MMKLSLLTIAFLAVGQNVLAQPVGAGGQLQQIPPTPAQPKSIPDLRIERSQPPADATSAGVRIAVRTLHVTGETRFTEAELIAVADFQPGRELDLASLRAMAARITDFYNRHGYFVAQAYLPAQNVQDGAVTIAVVEGRYGKVALANHAHVSNGLTQGLLAGLEPGDAVIAAPLERRLLLLSDLPGVRVKSTLTPGEAVGTSDMLVDLAPTRRVTGSLEGDNAGNRYTGAWRGGGTLNLNEPIGIGDVASLRVLTSGSGLTYVRGAYQAQIQAVTVGVAYAHLNYRLGREFAPLHARGTVDIASAYGSYPLIRSRDTNLYALLDLDLRTLKDRVGSTSSVSDRSEHVVGPGLSGDHRDRLWGGGFTSFAANWSFGDLNLKTPAVRAIDAVTARTNGSYQKLSFEAARLQGLSGPFSLYGEIRGQLASKNLDSSEKMELGGAYGVRAYPEGEAYGDQGYILTGEARMQLARPSAWTGGQMQAALFVDTGSVTLNKSPWVAGSNARTLSAVGVGLTWADAHNLVVKASYATKLGDERATSAPDRAERVWVQVSKFF
jgi:hemolysin activation/secretion protein